MMTEFIITENAFTNPPPNRIIRPLNSDEFLLELAYHEASHLVIERLIHKLGLNFLESSKIKINSTEGTGNVFGFIANFNKISEYWTPENFANFVSFYTEDSRRVGSECLMLIAGFASRKKFISNDEYFISYFDKTSDAFNISYYKIDTVWHDIIQRLPNRQIVGISDFAKIKDRLSFIKIVEKKELVDTYVDLLDLILPIFDDEKVEHCISYIKDKLIENDGTVIEGDNF